jgi:hypothetical protein
MIFHWKASFVLSELDGEPAVSAVAEDRRLQNSTTDGTYIFGSFAFRPHPFVELDFLTFVKVLEFAPLDGRQMEKQVARTGVDKAEPLFHQLLDLSLRHHATPKTENDSQTLGVRALPQDLLLLKLRRTSHHPHDERGIWSLLSSVVR